MSRDIIEKTAFCYFSVDDDCYVVESSKLPSVAAIGETEHEAWECFAELLDETMPKIEAGKVAGCEGPGRPAKNGCHIHAQVQSSTKTIIESLAKEFGISQTDAIDHLAFHFERTRNQDKFVKVSHAMEELLAKVEAGAKRIEDFTKAYSSVFEMFEDEHVKKWLQSMTSKVDESSNIQSSVTVTAANNLVKFPTIPPAKMADAS